jgi:hypothetical protein
MIVGDALAVLRTLPNGIADCCVTSPPYWSMRDYAHAGQIGREPVLDCLGWATSVRCGECYVCRQVAVFREVRRVLVPPRHPLAQPRQRVHQRRTHHAGTRRQGRRPGQP